MPAYIWTIDKEDKGELYHLFDAYRTDSYLKEIGIVEY